MVVLDMDLRLPSHTVDGRNAIRLRQWEATVCWYLQGTPRSRVSKVLRNGFRPPAVSQGHNTPARAKRSQANRVPPGVSRSRTGKANFRGQGSGKPGHWTGHVSHPSGWWIPGSERHGKFLKYETTMLQTTGNSAHAGCLVERKHPQHHQHHLDPAWPAFGLLAWCIKAAKPSK